MTISDGAVGAGRVLGRQLATPGSMTRRSHVAWDQIEPGRPVGVHVAEGHARMQVLPGGFHPGCRDQGARRG